ncbi:hypothetical protein SLCC98_10021 [Listeria monocytogenes]|nr:hypothetical protein LM900261_10021 [Listeria monocytogenes]CUM17943.1 hypothetical protein SLCC98_10021 [Listeria monocytogenes]
MFLLMGKLKAGLLVLSVVMNLEADLKVWQNKNSAIPFNGRGIFCFT